MTADVASSSRLTGFSPVQYAICLKGIVWREGLRFLHQRERFVAALVRPLVWLFIFAVGFRQVLGVSIIGLDDDRRVDLDRRKGTLDAPRRLSGRSGYDATPQSHVARDNVSGNDASNADQAASAPEALAAWVAIASISAGDRQS